MHVCDPVRSLNHLVVYVKINMNNLCLALIPAAFINVDNMVTCRDQWLCLDNLENDPKEGRNIGVNSIGIFVNRFAVNYS